MGSCAMDHSKLLALPGNVSMAFEKLLKLLLKDDRLMIFEANRLTNCRVSIPNPSCGLSRRMSQSKTSFSGNRPNVRGVLVILLLKSNLFSVAAM